MSRLKKTFFTFLTNRLQIFTKFLNVENFRLQNFVRGFGVSKCCLLHVMVAVRAVRLPNLLLINWSGVLPKVHLLFFESSFVKNGIMFAFCCFDILL